jgi:glycosyltransferase involved in cell wall biosynthesis
MKVALFGGLDTGWGYSMQRYADQLAAALRTQAGPDDSFELHYGPSSRLPAPLSCSRRLAALANEGLATRVLYPRMALGMQGEINHVLDHSFGSLASVLPPETTVVTCHDLIPLQVPGIHRTIYSRLTGRRWFVKCIEDMARARRIIAISEHTKREVVKWTGYDPHRIIVIPHGVADCFRPPGEGVDLESVKRQLGLRSGCKYLLHVGSCQPNKNLPALFKTFALVRRKVDYAVQLLRLGPPLTASLEWLVSQLGLQECILRLEGLAVDELTSVYHVADALLYPSTYEGFGRPVLEAMACGLPVVASSAAAISEVLGEGQLTFAPDDHEGMAEAVVRIFQEPDLRATLIERGLHRTEAFSWEMVAQRTRAVYEELLEEDRVF